MAANRKARARRRIADRTKRNALALATGAEIAADQPTKRTYARTRTRLEELAARQVISRGQQQAGERLAKDWRWSGEQLGHLVARYEPRMPKGSGARFNDAPGQIDARARFEAALQAVGQMLSPILVHTCLCDESPSAWGPLNGKAASDGPPVLRLALDALAAHYREARQEAA